MTHQNPGSRKIISIKKRTDRLNAVLAHGVNVGDFVQKNIWFGDIWAEVVRANVGRQEHSSVDVIVYDKYGRSRIRKVLILETSRRSFRQMKPTSIAAIFIPIMESEAVIACMIVGPLRQALIPRVIRKEEIALKSGIPMCRSISVV